MANNGFHAAASHEKKLHAKLRKVAQMARGVIQAHIDPDNPDLLIDREGMMRTLASYGESLGKSFAPKLVSEISQAGTVRALRTWSATGDKIAKELKGRLAKIQQSPELAAMRRDQVALIKQMPDKLGAHAIEKADALRLAINEKVLQNSAAGLRSTKEDVLALYQEAGLALNESADRFANNSAALVARTETAKVNALVNQQVAESVGVTHYIWRTMGDGAVRDAHAHMEGKVCRYDDPPDPDDGFGAHGPGEVPNCRCFADPVIGQTE